MHAEVRGQLWVPFLLAALYLILIQAWLQAWNSENFYLTFPTLYIGSGDPTPIRNANTL